SRAEDLAQLPDDVVRLRGRGADPRCAVRPGDRVVGLEGDPVARGLDDLDAGGRRLAKAVDKLHQPLLQYFGHGAILAGDAALAAVYLSLSAAFAAIVALVCYLGCAVLVAGPGYRSVESVVSPMWRQVGAAGATALLAVLAYVAFRGDFVTARYSAGPLDLGAVANLLLAHDTLATEAIAAPAP